ncbi:glycerate kinase [Croceiramulus getboli]|nr:glycerate kinase [Flavobacteriaceae bacterium YJPT1-3]
MNILIAPDSYKESLTATEVAQAMATGIRALAPDANLTLLPFSDGGEGAFEVLLALNLGQLSFTDTVDPLGRPLRAPYFLFNDQQTAWIELSQASGLALLQPAEQNPIHTSTFGTGLQIKHALERGCRKIILGIGGSATHDVATGIFTALGGKLQNTQTDSLPACGKNLGAVQQFDRRQMHTAIPETQFIVACDVSNVLLGATGAAHTYARQKGASPRDIHQLELGTAHLASLLATQAHQDITDLPGGGAAGGTAAGMAALFNATLEPGFNLLSAYAALPEKIAQADLILTGEGRTDEQSQYGKVPFKIAALAKKANKTTLIYSGGVSVSPDLLERAGIAQAFAIKTEAMTLDYAKTHARELLIQTIKNTLKHWLNGD